MKRKILSALAALAALVFASCSNFNNDEQTEEITGTNAYVKISLADSSRTALPAVSNVEEFTRFTLTGTTATEGAAPVSETTWESSGTESAYAKMTAANIAVTVGASYTFTLTAEKGGAKWQGSTAKTIAQGTNSLSFTLELASISTEGTGSLSVTLTVPAAVNAVDAALKALDESTTLSPEGASTVLANGKATYTAGSIASGNYVLVFSLYGDTEKTLKLGEWREYAGITNGLTSTSSPEISGTGEGALQKLFTITLNTNGGTLTGTVPGSYTMYSSTITLPTATGISKTNYDFEGWYDAQTGGSKIESIAAGSTGNKTLYAHWTPDANLTAANAVTEKINAIGTVAYTADCKKKVDAARTAYDALTDAQKALVSAETLAVLTNAEGQVPGIGDVLLSDGTVVRYVANQTFTEDQKSKAIGVMYGFKEDGAPAGWLGIHNLAAGTNWAIIGTTGYNTNFTDIQCTSSPSGSGVSSTATFTGDTDGSDNWAYICSVDPNGSADAVTNYPAFDYVNKYATTVRLTGTYAAGWYMPSIAELTYIYRSRTTLNTVLQALGGTQLANRTYWSSSQSGDSIGASWALNFRNDFLNPGAKSINGSVCCVRAFSNVAVTGLSLDKTTAQTVTVGSSTSFTATVAPDNATDKTVKWSVSGTGITLYCDSACSTAITTDTATSILTVYAKGTAAGNATVTVTSNADSTKTASCAVKVQPPHVGDVLLSDGTIVPYDANRTFTEDQKTKAVGVLYTDASGAPAGWLGIHNSAGGTNSGRYIWAKQDTTGSNTNFTDIQCTPIPSGRGAASTATFTGDTDGSDNWAYICSQDSTASENAAENYPAFNYVNKYAANFGLSGTYATGWYMPSIAELTYIYRNQTTLNAVLEALGGTQLASSYYRSSSQDSSDSLCAWVLSFDDGYIRSDYHKLTTNRVCCVRAFSN